MITTVDQFGFKKHFLHKHHRFVDRFYKKLARADYQSEAALRLQAALRKEPRQVVHFSRLRRRALEQQQRGTRDQGICSTSGCDRRIFDGLNGIAGILGSSERLPNLQIHGRGLSGFPPFGREGHSRLRGKPARAQATDANQPAGRLAGRCNPRHLVVSRDRYDIESLRQRKPRSFELQVPRLLPRRGYLARLSFRR